MRWKNASDEKPNQGEQVLFAFRNADGSSTDTHIGWWDGAVALDGLTLVMEYETDDDDWLPCSHWMRLPQLPSVSETAGTSAQPTTETEPGR